MEALRDKIAYISQETFLFNGTIIENLMLGNPYLTYEEIIEACKKAQIHDFINSLPLRYNTLVGVASGKCGFHTLRAFSPLIPMVCRLFRYSKVYIVL